MAAKHDPHVFAHQEWINFIRPTGLVVSAPALVHAGAILDRSDAEGQRLLRACVEPRTFDPAEGEAPYLPDFRRFAESVLGWRFSPKAYAGTDEAPIPDELLVALQDYGETLRPDFAVRELEPKDGGSAWQLLVRTLEPGQDFDRPYRGPGGFEASPHGRMEALLRQTGVRAGLLFNGRAIRLLSAPKAESSGWLDFRVAEMMQTAGRPITAALRLLLNERRLLALPRSQRFAALLEESRKFQNEVSEQLAEQVLHALYELVRGLQAADVRSQGALLREALADDPDEVYRALLNVILRLVFLFYAEERDMLPADERFLRYYSVVGLHERLREDAALYPDTLDQRYGAWAQLLVLFRMVHDGASAGEEMRLPSRHGALFDPDRFPFLEGRAAGSGRSPDERIEPPSVSDGVIFRALEKLLVLDGERISYRALDVEEIGSVYETMMGFRLERATGRSVAIKAAKKHGAPTALDVDALLAQPGTKRAKWFQERTDRKLTPTAAKPVAAAETIEDLHAALGPVIDSAATPDLVGRGAMVLQPSEERRRSGSHYTPRLLTEPIVQTTLKPVLAQLRKEAGGPPRPEAILGLKVCDPAMGSGAFLVEACRQLGEALVDSWRAHEIAPPIPPDEDAVVYAQRLVAQRCLYGVDKNPMAVNLAKVSLWLATLARDHAFTFLDHSLRCGDSLVGLTARQIAAMHWEPGEPTLFEQSMRDRIRRVTASRREILSAREDTAYRLLEQKLSGADDALNPVRQAGDATIAAFFAASKKKARDEKRQEYAELNERAEAGDVEAIGELRTISERLAEGEKGVRPFHWEVEFPEVFEIGERLGRGAGFDAIVGNPPFMGSTMLGRHLGSSYTDWLREVHAGTAGKCDLVAFFFRTAYELIREEGAFGLIATKTIAQGDSRSSGLMRIVKDGGVIYSATRRLTWPGQAAVVVSVVHVAKNLSVDWGAQLDGEPVKYITSYLVHLGGDDEPKPLAGNANKAFLGTKPGSKSFVFGDRPGNLARSLVPELLRNGENREVIRPYIGGSEFNSDPIFAAQRFIIDFGDLSLEKAQQYEKVFSLLKDHRQPVDSDREWWKFARRAFALYSKIASFDRVLAISENCGLFSFGFMANDRVFSNSLYIFAFDQWQAFGVCQSRIHERWVRSFASSFKDDQRYVGADCFETFPFPENWETHPVLEAAGREYYEFRAALMIRNDEGLTKTYNRFHDPYEKDADIARLRELHAAMDRAVLDAYGWTDVPVDCEFLLDYEIDEESWGKKKKPYRYRWPDDVRDDVLARLLELNAARAAEEARSGLAAAPKKRRKKSSRRAPPPTGMKGLFE